MAYKNIAIKKRVSEWAKPKQIMEATAARFGVNQLAIDAWNDIRERLNCPCSPRQHRQAVSRIKAAIMQAVVHALRDETLP